MVKINPLDPNYMKGFNDGVTHGKKETFNKFTDYLMERLRTLGEIEGIGEKTIWKIHKHFLDGLGGKDE